VRRESSATAVLSFFQIRESDRASRDGFIPTVLLSDPRSVSTTAAAAGISKVSTENRARWNSSRVRVRNFLSDVHYAETPVPPEAWRGGGGAIENFCRHCGDRVPRVFLCRAPHYTRTRARMHTRTRGSYAFSDI